MSDYDEGNSKAGARCVEQLSRFINLNKGKHQLLYRADSASYQKELINLCECKDIGYAIGALCTSMIREEVCERPESAWEHLIDEDGHETVHEVARLTYQGIGQRTIVTRKPIIGQLTLDIDQVSRIVSVEDKAYKLSVITTNRSCSDAEVVRWYRKRCGFGERQHSTLKQGLGGNHTPSKHLHVNAHRWYVLVIAFNLMNMMKRRIGGRYRKMSMKALRLHLIAHAGYFVTHAGKTILKTTEALFELDSILAEQSHPPNFI